MKYLFILGRNIELSKAEVFSYFEKIGNRILKYELEKNGLFLDLENPIKENEIDFLGGVISIGKVIASGTEEELLKNIDKEELYFGTENKLNYTIWDFSKNLEVIRDYLKERFKKEKLKATLKHLTREIKLQEGEMANVPSSKLINEEYFIFGDKELFFGKIFQTCNYEIIEERDMNKPVRRESLAISPRLAKIMINLSKVKEDEILLDPFCGIGTILSEALLQKIKVMGIDKDEKAIIGAKQNLEWSKFDKKDYQLINSNSTKTQINYVNAIATEPDLGEILKKIPTKNKAKETLQKFEDLIVNILNNFREKISGRVVFTSPNIRIGKKRIHPEIEKILKRTDYKLIYELPEFRENQIVGRMIYVLEK